jgi:hypothetical protein
MVRMGKHSAHVEITPKRCLSLLMEVAEACIQKAKVCTIAKATMPAALAAP